MAKVELSPVALANFQEHIDFLLATSPDNNAPEQFSELIRHAVADLMENPFISGYSSIGGEFRELTLRANKKRGYRLLYTYEKNEEIVTILAIKDARQQRFTGF